MDGAIGNAATVERGHTGQNFSCPLVYVILRSQLYRIKDGFGSLVFIEK